jgi:hypothetical protein
MAPDESNGKKSGDEHHDLLGGDKIGRRRLGSVRAIHHLAGRLMCSLSQPSHRLSAAFDVARSALERDDPFKRERQNMKFLQHGFGLIVVVAVLLLVIALWRSRRKTSSSETNSERFRDVQDAAETNRRAMDMARQAAETAARQSEGARRAAEAATRNNFPR